MRSLWLTKYLAPRALQTLCPVVLLLSVAVAPTGAAGRPEPGVGVFFRAEDLPELRAKMKHPDLRKALDEILEMADEGMAAWHEDKQEHNLPETVKDLPDVDLRFSLSELFSKPMQEAAVTLREHMIHGAPAAAFIYMLNGKDQYAAYAWDVFEHAARVKRWGWVPWKGVHAPTIKYAETSRNMVLIADCIWNELDAEQRRFTREVIAEKVVEPFYRIALGTPGMGLHHLRGGTVANQGHNALSAALTGSCFVGDAVPGNETWFRAIWRTYHWAITHTVGRMAEQLQSGGPGGYWDISIHNLYSAAHTLKVAAGVDVREHPGLAEATLYPIVHQTTVPPLDRFTDPVDRAYQGTAGLITSNPVELPSTGGAGGWWYGYAAAFPDSPAGYFVGHYAPPPDGRAGSHQGALKGILEYVWWTPKLSRLRVPAPKEMALFSSRVASFRDGYDLGDTYMLFRGEIFLSAKDEVLAVVSGMDRWYDWHQYQMAETGMETEGELFAPSMRIAEAGNNERFAWIRAENATSEITYYPKPQQRESHRHYDERRRGICFVRPADGVDGYFLFHDRVQHRDRADKWYAWLWHLWNPVRNREENGASWEVLDKAAIRGHRPNADLLVRFLAPERVGVEVVGIPSQPKRSFENDFNGLMLRAIAGGYEPTNAEAVTIPISAWPDRAGEKTDEFIHMDKPITGEDVRLETGEGITGGTRYRCSLRCRDKDYSVDANFAWWIDLALLDASGRVIARPHDHFDGPDPLRLHAPRSKTAAEEWTETVTYFDAPEDAVAVRATFHAAEGGFRYQLGQLWLDEIKLEPVGQPVRTRSREMLALVMPLDKRRPGPEVRREADGHVIRHRNGVVDRVTVSGSDVRIVRQKGGGEIATFSSKRIAEAQATALAENSEQSAHRLAQGLAPLTERLRTRRDLLKAAGYENLASGAKVTASAQRDDRFGPEHLVSGKVLEYAADGKLDYTLGRVRTTQTGGYGQGGNIRDLMRDPDTFPLYVRPTWWLLPKFRNGWAEVELAEPSAVSLVRLLNTSNAGLNDFAALSCRVQLLDENGNNLAERDVTFGRPWKRAFEQAYAVPELFTRFSSMFGKTLRPETPVPFGAGWQNVFFDGQDKAQFVRVHVTDYWALGGGLNEIQIYAGPTEADLEKIDKLEKLTGLIKEN